MAYSDLISRAALEAGITKRAARRVLDQLVATALQITRGGGTFRIPKLGRFKVVERAPRVARNPRTGEAMQLPARRVLLFKPAASVRV